MTLQKAKRIRNLLAVVTVACYMSGCSQLGVDSSVFTNPDQNLIRVLAELILGN
jgi:hypothetical protein